MSRTRLFGVAGRGQLRNRMRQIWRRRQSPPGYWSPVDEVKVVVARSERPTRRVPEGGRRSGAYRDRGRGDAPRAGPDPEGHMAQAARARDRCAPGARLGRLSGPQSSPYPLHPLSGSNFATRSADGVERDSSAGSWEHTGSSRSLTSTTPARRQPVRRIGEQSASGPATARIGPLRTSRINNSTQPNHTRENAGQQGLC